MLGDVRRAPDHAAGWSRLGRRYLDQGDLDAARLCGERAEVLDPSDREALLLVAATARGGPESAAGRRDLCTRAFDGGGAHPALYVTLSLAHLAAGEEAQAALRLRAALLTLPHDLHVRRALRTVLACCSPLYRVLSAPRRAVDWLRGYVASTRFGFLPVIELGYLLVTFVGILLNPFHELRPAALFVGVGLMAIWWPLVATLEALASLRLRSPEISSIPPNPRARRWRRWARSRRYSPRSP